MSNTKCLGGGTAACDLGRRGRDREAGDLRRKLRFPALAASPCFQTNIYLLELRGVTLTFYSLALTR